MTEVKYEGFYVRQATKSDVDGIYNIMKTAFQSYVKLAKLNTTDALQETKEDVERDIDEKLVLVAVIDDLVGGSVRIKIDGDEGYLSRFGVDTNYQNIGIGKCLMNMVDIKMRAKGIKKLKLHTASKVTSLVRFYYSRGFYIDEISKDRGYVRALLIKEYKL